MWNPYWNELSDVEKRIVNDKLLNIIKFHPHDSEALGGELKGLRSYNKSESDLRIYFAICFECKKEGFTEVNNCPDCDSMKNNVVKLFAAGPHSLYDILGRERRKRLKKRKKR